MRNEIVVGASVSYAARSTASDDDPDSSFEPAIGAISFGSTFVRIGLRSLWRVVFDFHLWIWQ